MHHTTCEVKSGPCGHTNSAAREPDDIQYVVCCKLWQHTAMTMNFKKNLLSVLKTPNLMLMAGLASKIKFRVATLSYRPKTLKICDTTLGKDVHNLGQVSISHLAESPLFFGSYPWANGSFERHLTWEFSKFPTLRNILSGGRSGRFLLRSLAHCHMHTATSAQMRWTHRCLSKSTLACTELTPHCCTRVCVEGQFWPMLDEPNSWVYQDKREETQKAWHGNWFIKPSSKSLV